MSLSKAASGIIVGGLQPGRGCKQGCYRAAHARGLRALLVCTVESVLGRLITLGWGASRCQLKVAQARVRETALTGSMPRRTSRKRIKRST